jgi:hypothetical protein
MEAQPVGKKDWNFFAETFSIPVKTKKQKRSSDVRYEWHLHRSDRNHEDDDEVGDYIFGVNLKDVLQNYLAYGFTKDQPYDGKARIEYDTFCELSNADTPSNTKERVLEVVRFDDWHDTQESAFFKDGRLEKLFGPSHLTHFYGWPHRKVGKRLHKQIADNKELLERALGRKADNE